MDELIARLTQLACMDRSSDTPVTEQTKEAMLEAAASITALRDEVAKLREATNQCRLAFAGYVSVQSAINKLDALATEKNDA